jgi:hypothetical protein
MSKVWSNIGAVVRMDRSGRWTEIGWANKGEQEHCRKEKHVLSMCS